MVKLFLIYTGIYNGLSMTLLFVDIFMVKKSNDF